ncbi:hypothetical protein [Flavobacterium ginsengisoli]|uniref:hypothetical protein n=1 Tax=Flavobacterium ginsengisoli TaxID=871694 RepID=UPI0030F99558
MALGPGDVNTYAPGLPLSAETVTGTTTYKNNEVIKTYGGLEPRIRRTLFPYR